MIPFEEELRQALNRREPAADFTARVLARAAAEDAKKNSSFWFSWRLGLATAAVAVLTLSGGVVYQQHERSLRGLAAKRQLLIAIRITGTKLQQVQERVKESEQETQ
jgi:anti-sigma-K factor RskA